eukprot:SM000034S12808  [mRNA]  locus=s34:843081:848940:- [translate_table: standard]
MVKVSVKWQKELFEDVEIDVSQLPLVFKGQMFALTGVAPERQKIMVKGGLLQDDAEWSKVAIKEGQKLMMMGTADALPSQPVDKTTFLEDLPHEEQEAAANSEYSAGLINLGETCYMNSTIQCLQHVPELNSALSLYSDGSGITQDRSHKLALATRDLFVELKTSQKPVAPFRFTMFLRELFPQFAETSEGGAPMQQDAEECWTQLLSTLSERLKSSSVNTAGAGRLADPVKELFGIELVSTLRCAETGEESIEKETVYMLKCHISAEVNFLQEGLKQGLKDEVEKNSVQLGRSAVFKRDSLISRLPKYLTVQFVRFFWKRESQQKAKILRKVGYPLVLDIYAFCTEELKEALTEPRKAAVAEDEQKAGLEKATSNGKVVGQDASKDVEATRASSGAMPEAAAQVNISTAMEADVNMADSKESDRPTTSFTSGEGSSQGADEQKRLMGMYDLVSVLTHKGRSADSGHYVSWVKQESGTWVNYTDEKLFPKKDDDIVRLSGGGDWHMAYILLYKARLAPAG